MAEGAGSGTTVAVYATFPDLAVAERIGRAVIEAGLAACVNIVPGMRSIYRWKGAIESADEVIGPDRAAFRVWVTLRDGRRIVEHVIIHYADGRITRQVDVEAWD